MTARIFGETTDMKAGARNYNANDQRQDYCRDSLVWHLDADNPKGQGNAYMI
jgi:hypothetical protein